MAMDRINLFIENLNKRFPQRVSSKTGLLAIISLVILYRQTIGKLIHPPRQLRHIPHVNYIQFFIMSMVQKKPLSVISKALTMPLLDTSAVYLKPERLGWTVHVATPEAAKQFFLKTDIYAKANAYTTQKDTLFYKFIGPKNILFEHDKNEWKKHRKLVNPAFHKSKPVKLFGVLGHKVFKIVDEANGKPIDVTSLMERYTLDVIGQAGFGFDFDAIIHKDNDWVTVYNDILNAVTDPLYFFLPFLDSHFRWLLRDRRKKYELVEKFHGMITGVIEKKRQILQEKYSKKMQDNSNDTSHDDEDDGEKDLLTLMLESEFSEGGSILTNDEVKSNLNVFFLAGHDTTANALSFAIHALARHPDIQQKAREEAIRVLGDEPHDVLPTYEDIRQFDYINQVIKETMRFHGPVTTGMPRQTTEDTNLVGIHLPKGTPIVVDIYDLHHNPHVWDDPETYDPSRFAPGGEADQKASATGSKDGSAMAWSPFFNGQRMCIGMQFSLEEQRVILSCLLRKYEWRLPEDSIHKNEAVTTNIGVLTAKNLDIIFKRRY
ncbi:cytochrome P450 [Absidia repens]|uniref:Cytochrome P450 n=1 Tax=Absidia repens TaxID=90262 RepID=A0A1X2HZ24_9FUNG|nr:cytochrome P450 [Absidia repens]